jgi:hypothetical protein
VIHGAYFLPVIYIALSGRLFVVPVTRHVAAGWLVLYFQDEKSKPVK